MNPTNKLKATPILLIWR